MTRRTWKQATELLANEDFIISCAEDGVEPKEALNIASYTRAEKCSHPIDLNRINMATGEISPVKVPCDTNQALICHECSEFKKRLRVVQMLNTLDREGVQSLFLTLTAPSFGRVHHSSWSLKDQFQWRNLNDADLYHKRLSILKSRDDKKCGCGIHHNFDDALVGTPLGAYNYLEEVLFNKNLPNLMANTLRTLKYRAKLAGIPAEDFRIWSCYERQKRGSLHAHFLLVVDNNPAGFGLLFDDLKEHWAAPTATPTPTAEIPASTLHGLEVGFSRVLEDETLLSRQPKTKRTLAAVIPTDKKGRTRTRWGKQADIKILEPDTETPDTEVPEIAGIGDSEAFNVEIPSQPRSYARAAFYLAKYLSKGSNNFSPDSLKAEGVSPAQELHFSMFRRAAILLFTDKLVFDARVKQLKQDQDHYRWLLETSPDNPELVNHGFPELYMDEKFQEQIEDLMNEGVRRNAFSDMFVTAALQGTLTVKITRDILSRYGTGFIELQRWSQQLAHTPLMRVKMMLNRLANNGGFTGTLSVTSNWLDTLKDLKEKRQEFYLAENPDVEADEYIWELARSDEWSFDGETYRHAEHRAEQADPHSFHRQKVIEAQARYFKRMKDYDPDDTSKADAFELLLYMDSEAALTYVDYDPPEPNLVESLLTLGFEMLDTDN